MGWMDCGTQGELCDNLDVSSSTTAYFPPGATINNKEKGGVLVGLVFHIYVDQQSNNHVKGMYESFPD